LLSSAVAITSLTARRRLPRDGWKGLMATGAVSFAQNARIDGMLAWLRKWRERAAKAQEESEQKRWDAEQARRRESLASQRAWEDLQTAMKSLELTPPPSP
jgi:hypothetical protein